MHSFVGSLLLVVAIAGMVAGVRALLALCGEQRASVIAASTAALMAAAPLTLQPLTGIIAAVLLPGCVGGATALLLRRMLPTTATTATTATTTTTAPPWSLAARCSAAALGGLLAFTACGTFLWDEASTHLPLAAAVARDLHPLQHPLFPGQPLRYHVGFDVVVGSVRAFTLLPLDQCMDLVTVGGIALLLCTLHDLASALKSGSAALAMPVVLLGGGPVAALLADGWGMALWGKTWFPPPWVNGAVFPPLVVTNVFQHPQGLAMPIACATLMVAAVPTFRRFVVAALLLVLCSRVQIVFAAVTGAAVLLLAARSRNVGGVMVLLVAAGLCAADSGFTEPGATQLVWGGAFAHDGAPGIGRVLLTFGLSLGAPIFGLMLWRRDRQDLILALMLAGSVGFVVGNVVSYARSWDIVKFFSVSAFFSHFLWAAAITRAPRTLGVIVVACSCWSGALWLVRHGVGNGLVASAYREQGQGDDVAAFADHVAGLIPASSRVFTPDLSLARAGVLVPGTDWRASRDTAALLIDRKHSEALTLAWRRARQDLDADALRTLGAEFVVVRAGSLLEPLLANTRRFTPVALAPTAAHQPWLLFQVANGGAP